MFLLRIAEALVNSQEAHYASSLTSDPNTIDRNGHRSASGSPMETSSTVISTVSGESTTNEALPEANEHSSPVHRSSSHQRFALSPSSATTTSLRTVSPNPSNSPCTVTCSSSPEHDGQLLTHGRRAPTGQCNQGLLYSLLVSNETGASQPHSPLQCASSLFTSMLKPPLLRSKHNSEGEEIRKENGNGVFQDDSDGKVTMNGSSLSSSVKCKSHTLNILGKGGTKLTALHGSFRNRASSVGSKVSAGRPHLRTYAAASDSCLGTKARLQRRRHSELASNDIPSLSAQPHSVSGYEESQTTGSAENNLVVGLLGSHLSSPQSSSHPSPRVANLNHTIPARSMGKSYEALSYSSSFLTEPHRSLSADSGVDEPIDLTGICTPPAPGASDEQQVSPETGKPVTEFESTFVQLAKKTARPVQSRITEWLRQLVEFVALSAPVLGSVCVSPSLNLRSDTNGHSLCSDMLSWVSLLSSCWHRLLVLNMVEHALDLVVVEDRSPQLEAVPITTGLDQLGIPWILLADVQNNGLVAALEPGRRPDRDFTDRLMHLMSELRQAALSAQEFYLLRHAVLLTAQDPSVLPTLGLNVIRTFRSVNPTSEAPITKSAASNGSSRDSPASFIPAAPVNPAHNADCFDLACLFSGLKTLSGVCPYQMANLFCTHLIGGSLLTQSSLYELHGRILSSMLCVAGASEQSSTTNGVCLSDERTGDNDGSTVQRLKNGTSILEQLFDSF
ncbi:hypothetical protein CRM22_002964 [Opisthorchis felineus]|uniref:Uncharacterized protein n=1 Tax=Opisthorchis felineus TaxID=147828 RepID=A0A4S2M9N8_OPIFE|nr:hypothetical protein CRM22_002964 [Opisthorchis felineus]